MATLRIHLKEGFDDDHVRVTVDGEPVLDAEGLRTDYSVGLARTITAEVPEGSARVEVRLPERNLSSTADHRLAGSLDLDVRVTPGGSLEQAVSRGGGELY